MRVHRFSRGHGQVDRHVLLDLAPDAHVGNALQIRGDLLRPFFGEGIVDQEDSLAAEALDLARDAMEVARAEDHPAR